jgi:hypothetical protein
MSLGTAEPREVAGSLHHLVRRAAGEGEEEDPLWQDAAVEQARHPLRQGARLARAGAGEHAHRTDRGLNHLELLGIEPGIRVPRERQHGAARLPAGLVKLGGLHGGSR